MRPCKLPDVGDDESWGLQVAEPDVIVDSDLLEQIDEDGDLAEPD